MTPEPITITLTPFQAMQLIRFEAFFKCAIVDPIHGVEKHDVLGISESLNEIRKQVITQINIPQLQDAFITRDVKKLTMP